MLISDCFNSVKPTFIMYLNSIVCTNLISNTIKYSSKEDNSEILISSSLNDHTIAYSIKDNGAGLDLKYLHKLFGVFQRLHSEAEFEGNGVGLAIVQRIVLKHGARHGLKVKQGKGRRSVSHYRYRR
jgi:light-regulated signal transduction histidine kinase (bacteriophytochrome)